MKKEHKRRIFIFIGILLIILAIRISKPLIEESKMINVDLSEGVKEATNIKNGKYVKKLGLPNLNDDVFKNDTLGTSIKRFTKIRGSEDNSADGFMYVMSRKMRFIDGSIVTRIMSLSILREHEELVSNNSVGTRRETAERVRFQVEFNKTIIYREDGDSFYVKDGDMKITAPYICIEPDAEDEKTVVVDFEQHLINKFKVGRDINKRKEYPSNYKDQMEILGRTVRMAEVDFGDRKLSHEGEFAELKATFFSDDEAVDTVVCFSFHDKYYGNHMGCYK